MVETGSILIFALGFLFGAGFGMAVVMGLLK
jgi:hypothetical protein